MAPAWVSAMNCLCIARMRLASSSSSVRGDLSATSSVDRFDESASVANAAALIRSASSSRGAVGCAAMEQRTSSKTHSRASIWARILWSSSVMKFAFSGGVQFIRQIARRGSSVKGKRMSFGLSGCPGWGGSAGRSTCRQPAAIAARPGRRSPAIVEPAACPAESRLLAAGQTSLPARTSPVSRR